MSDRYVFVVTLVDRHFDDIVTVHESKEGSDSRVASIKVLYERDEVPEWKWHGPSESWSSFDDGPKIRVQRVLVQP